MREGAAASPQSWSWPPSSSAERSLALGEEERVETLLRPFYRVTQFSWRLGCGNEDANIKAASQQPPAVNKHHICK